MIASHTRGEPHADAVDRARWSGDAGLMPLFTRWQRDGDQRARDQLVKRYLPLARKLARRYAGTEEPLDDLVQIASLALVKAIDRFDVERGLAFSSFAVPTITGELKRHFRDHGWAVHVPRSAQERALRAEKAVQELTGSTGQTPTVNQLAQYLEWELGDTLDALEAGAGHHAGSLDAPAREGDGEGDSAVAMLGAEDDRYEFVEARLSVAAAMHRLPLIERRVVYLRFIEDLTQTQIGARTGVSQMQVSRLLSSALDRLRTLTDADAG
jgi:RNA polymerase sigma-B factor